MFKQPQFTINAEFKDLIWIYEGEMRFWLRKLVAVVLELRMYMV